MSWFIMKQILMWSVVIVSALGAYYSHMDNDLFMTGFFAFVGLLCLIMFLFPIPEYPEKTKENNLEKI